MYRKLAALTFSSFVLLAGCSDSDSPATDSSGTNSDAGDTTIAGEATDTADVLLATADKGDVRVNGVRVYSNSIPTRILQFGPDGAVFQVSQFTIDEQSRTISDVTDFAPDAGEEEIPFLRFSVSTFNEFGQLVQIEGSESEDGIAPVEVFARADFVYEGEQVITATQEFLRSGLIVEDTFDFDGNGRLVRGTRFSQGNPDLSREWVREYNGSGWVETEVEREGDLSLLISDEVSLNDAGLIQRVVTTLGSSFQITAVLTYDELGRLTQSEIFSESGELEQRTEYLDFQGTDMFWHNVPIAIEALSLFHE